MGDAADMLFDNMFDDFLEITSEYYQAYCAELRLNLTNKVWKTSKGDLIPITDMSTGHLINSIRFIKERGKESFCGTAVKYVNAMVKELKAREVEHEVIRTAWNKAQ